MSRTASEHRPTIEGENAYALEARIKQVDRQVIGAARLGIIPQRKLWVVTKEGRVRRVHLQRVEKVSPGGIGGLGHADALPELRSRKRGKREVTHHPAISDLIVESDGVTIVLVIATGIAGAQRSKE